MGFDTTIFSALNGRVCSTVAKMTIDSCVAYSFLLKFYCLLFIVHFIVYIVVILTKTKENTTQKNKNEK